MTERRDWVMRVMTDEKVNELFQLTDEILGQHPENHDDILDMITGKLFAMYTGPQRAVFNLMQMKQLVILRNLLASVNELKDTPIIGDIIRKFMEENKGG